MTFLNPLYLVALAAAAIPIILHLLNLRRTRVIEFSTLAFLRELQKSKIRRLKIRQWILLALRTLIIVSIVLAFARPAFRGTFAGLAGARAKSSVVIILDDSFSMLASDEGGQLLKQAKARAAGILDLLQPGDEAAFIRGSDPSSAQPQFTVAHNALRAEIDRVQPSFAHHTLHEALTAAHVLLDRSQNFNKEVYVITDEQRSHFIRADQEPALRLFNDQERIFLFPLGAQREQNTAVVSVAVQNSLFEKNKPVTVAATILNFGTRPLRGEVASLYLGGERVAQKSVDIDPGGRKEVELTAVPKSAGFVEGFVQIEDDILPEDNRRYFSFHVPEKITALLAAERPADALFLNTALRTALAPGPDQALDISTIANAQIGAVNLKNFDVLFLLAGKSLDAAAARRIADAVRAGIGVYLMPAGDADPAAGVNALFSALQLPGAQGMNGAPGNSSTYTQFGKIDFAHPLFAGMFLENNPKKPPRVESPRIYAALKFPPSERLQSVIATSAGFPFLMEGKIGAGRLIVSAVAPLLSWSDFPLRGLFVPLLNRSAYYLASRDMNALAHLVGETFDVTLPAPPEGSAVYTISSPARVETRITPRALASGLTFQIADDPEPGLYTIKCNGQTSRVIPVNIDPAESDLTRLSPEERKTFWAAVGISHPRVLGRDADIHREVMQSRFGLELWKYLCGAAILFALLEMLIARDVKPAPVEPAAA